MLDIILQLGHMSIKYSDILVIEIILVLVSSQINHFYFIYF